MPNPFQIPSYYTVDGMNFESTSVPSPSPDKEWQDMYSALSPGSILGMSGTGAVLRKTGDTLQDAYQGFQNLIHQGSSVEDLMAYQREAESRGFYWAMPASFYTNYNPVESRRYWESLHPTSPTTPTTPVETPTTPTTPTTDNTTTSPNFGNQSSFGTFDPFGTALADYFSGSYNSSPNYDPFGNFTRTHL